jgi:hypothetical protein
MKYAFALAAIGAAGSASAAVSAYGQCGGQSYSGETECASGWTCTKMNDYYSQCVAGGAAAATTLSTAAAVKPAAASSSSSSCTVKYITKPLSEKPTAAATAASKPASTQAASKPVSTQAASKPASSQVAASTAAVKPTAAVTTSSKAAGSGVKYGGVNVRLFLESLEAINQALTHHIDRRSRLRLRYRWHLQRWQPPRARPGRPRPDEPLRQGRRPQHLPYPRRLAIPRRRQGRRHPQLRQLGCLRQADPELLDRRRCSLHCRHPQLRPLERPDRWPGRSHRR